MKNIIILMLLLIVASSCNKQLIEHPKSIAESNFYNTPLEVEAALGAIYDPLRSSNCLGAVYESIQESASDWFKGRASYSPTSDFQGLDGTAITRVGKIWEDFYLSIRNANLVIGRVPQASDLNDDQKERYIAEAKFMRALDYFFLVRNWGGVPLRTEQNMDSINLSRSNREDIYKLIVNDLKFAEINLPENPAVAGHPSLWAAKTVLADVYFYEGKYEKAAKKADEVIQSGKYSLVKVKKRSDFNSLFGPDLSTTPEEIFYIKYSTESSWAYPIYTAGVGTPYLGVSGYYAIYGLDNNPLYANWDDNDLRKEYNWYGWDTPLGPNVILNKKFTDPGSKHPDNSYPLYKYSDVLLLYAEAACRAANSPTPEAMEKLNMVHRRAYGYDPLKPSPIDFKLSNYDKQSFINLVIMERGYETIAEGKRRLDLIRAGIFKEQIKAIWNKDVAKKAFLWPIPNSELNFNSSIDTQNPGY